MKPVIPSAHNGHEVPRLELDPRLYTPESDLLMRARGILFEEESMEDALRRTASALLDMDTKLTGTPDTEFATNVVEMINKGTICFGTPILTNAGREGSITAACTVLPLILRQGQLDIGQFQTDSHNALGQAVGTGYDLSDLEEPATSLLELNEALDEINQRLIAEQKRPVASMATLRADHPGVIDFIRAKREVDFGKWRFNISLFVTEELFAAAEEGRPWELRDSEGKVVGEVDANTLIDEIAECAHYCGEPGILFKDRIDYDNPTPQWEYKSTAPCAEVAMAQGEACQFSYVNVESLIKDGAFDKDAFAKAVATITRLLDSSVEYTIQNNDSLDFSLVEQKRRIGVGITGFADLLIRLKIPYDSPVAEQLAAEVSELLDYHSKVESVRLAKERGAFPAFTISRFVDPEWTTRKLPKSTGVVSQEEWEALFDDISEHGIRNASTTAMPPTGTSSAIIGASKSLEPLFDLHFRGQVHRSVHETLTEHCSPEELVQLLGQVASGAFMADDPRFSHLITAREISPSGHLSVQARFQLFLDEALAKTINLPNTATVGDVKGIIWDAYHHKLKGITVFRDNCLSERAESVAAN